MPSATLEALTTCSGTTIGRCRSFELGIDNVAVSVEPSVRLIVNVYVSPGTNGIASGGTTSPVSDLQQRVSCTNARTSSDAPGMHVLEDPSISIGRVGLHQRGRHRDSPSGTRSALVKEPGVARSKLAQHPAPRVLPEVFQSLSRHP
jgi:hypothetical protein